MDGWKTTQTYAVRFDGIRRIHGLQAVLEQGPQNSWQDVGVQEDAGGRVGDQVEVVVPAVAIVGMVQVAGYVATNSYGEDLKGKRREKKFNMENHGISFME